MKTQEKGGKTNKLTIKSKSFVIKVSLLVIYIFLSILMFVTGRTHSVIVDNKASEDGTVKAVNGMTVSVNKDFEAEFFRGDRDKISVKGQTLHVRVQSFDGKISYNGKVKLPIREDNLILSIPLLIAGDQNALMPFDL